MTINNDDDVHGSGGGHYGDCDVAPDDGGQHYHQDDGYDCHCDCYAQYYAGYAKNKKFVLSMLIVMHIMLGYA